MLEHIRKFCVKSPYQSLIVVFLFFVALVGFWHPDFMHTTIYSTFIDNDLYQKCQGCNYLPLIYFLFDLWQMPFELITGYDFTDPLQFIIGLKKAPYFFLYNKIMIVVAFFISAYFLSKISQALNISQPQKISTLYLLSPFCFFVIFIYAGYDIFAILFALMATHYFVGKRFNLAFLLFSISLSFKFFTVVIALTFLAHLRQSFTKKCMWLLTIFSVPLVQIFLYKNDPFFLEGIFALVFKNSSNQHLILNPAAFIAVSYVLWLVLLHFNERFNSLFDKQNIVFLPYVSILFLFCFSPIAPQWIVIILPFFYLIFLKEGFEKSLPIIELLFFVIFFTLIINIWPRGIDSNLATYGFINFFYSPRFLLKDVWLDLNNHLILVYLGYGFFYLYFFTPFLIKFGFKKFKFLKALTAIKVSTVNVFIICSLFIFVLYGFANVLTGSKGSFYGDLNQMSRLTYSYDHSQPFVLKSEATVCNVINNPYNRLQAIELRTKINSDLAEKIQFFYVLNQQEMKFDTVITDARSVFLKINDPLAPRQEIQVCILNKNDQNFVFDIAKESGSLHLLNLLPTFENKSFPMYLYYKSNSN